jgi:hypothetical protein
MALNPAIIALILISLLSAAFAVYAAGHGLQILRHWDLTNGSERQLRLERKTYLVSTVLLHLMVLSLASLFFFVYTAEGLHEQIIGAMCAAGSLYAEEAGYPALLTKIAIVLLCGLWLILNYMDNQAEDYPLIKAKYRLLTVIAAALCLESVFTISYFGGLKVDIITSCCGTLFSSESQTLPGHVASLPPKPMAVLFFVGAAATLRAAVQVLVTGRPARILGAFSALMFPVTIAAVLSFISVYYYELPTHHCPFCLLQVDYNYIGYPLYAALFTTTIAGSAVGVIDRFKARRSLTGIIRCTQRKLCWLTIFSVLIMAGIAAYPLLFSSFVLIH